MRHLALTLLAIDCAGIAAAADYPLVMTPAEAADPDFRRVADKTRARWIRWEEQREAGAGAPASSPAADGLRATEWIRWVTLTHEAKRATSVRARMAKLGGRVSLLSMSRFGLVSDAEAICANEHVHFTSRRRKAKN